MVKASKTPLSVSATESTEVVVKTAVPKVKKEKKSAPAVVVAEIEVVVKEPIADKEVDETEVVDNIPTKMADFSLKLQAVIALLSATKVSFKALEKVVVREFKVSQKASSKKSKRSGNRQPSGFIRPTLISDELALFLGKEVGSEMARTTVSREINQYVRANNLQDAKNGRQINYNDALKKLLNINDEEILTYFNLQRFMKHHFIKAVPAEVLASVAV